MDYRTGCSFKGVFFPSKRRLYVNFYTSVLNPRRRLRKYSIDLVLFSCDVEEC